MNQLPDSVRFHFTGDPTHEVFLVEHEESPFWIALALLAGIVIVIAILVGAHRSAEVRRMLGWESLQA